VIEPSDRSATAQERLDRARLVADIRLKRLAHALKQEELELARTKLDLEKQPSSTSGLRFLFSSTGVILVGAALGLIGTAAGKYGDYLIKKREQETSIILKASDVPAGLNAQLQAMQRAKNLLWFSQAGYIDLPDKFSRQLEQASGLKTGETPAAPIIEAPSGAPVAGAPPGEAGLRLVSKFEGIQEKPFKDASGLTTIGAGHVLTEQELKTGTILIAGKQVPYRDGITPDQARALLATDMAPAYRAVDSSITAHLTPGQRDALASFVWNVGVANLKRSKIPLLINSGQLAKVPEELERWSRVGGKALPGLVERRAAEADLWQQKK
jgi:GH24 family phage-related lysozyme (muramidase)